MLIQGRGSAIFGKRGRVYTTNVRQPIALLPTNGYRHTPGLHLREMADKDGRC